MLHFNPRSRKGSDANILVLYAKSQEFQPTLPQGERLTTTVLPTPVLEFQPTLPQGERRIHLLEMPLIILFQPTLPQGERPNVGPGSVKYTFISTHAPARGATYLEVDRRSFTSFQPTLPQGERRFWGVKQPIYSVYFNPRSRKGSDKHSILLLGIYAISTHAPARGATAIITNFHTQLLFKITIFSYIASPPSFPSSLFPDI